MLKSEKMSLFLFTLKIPLKPVKVTKTLSEIDILGAGGEGGVLMSTNWTIL